MIAIFDPALARGYEPRRQRSTLAKAEGDREPEEKRKNEDKVVLMLTQGEKKKKKPGDQTRQLQPLALSFSPPLPPVSCLQNFAAFPLFFPPFFIPARESSPRLLLAKPNYSGRHCLPDRKTDGQMERQTDLHQSAH